MQLSISRKLQLVVVKYNLFVSINTKYSRWNNIIGYNIITMGPNPFMKLHLSFTFASSISQDFQLSNLAIILWNLSFV